MDNDRVPLLLVALGDLFEFLLEIHGVTEGVG